jgi:L-2-hydroxyglutarate oxidase
MFRDWSKKAFTSGLKRYVPEIGSQDLVFGPSGVRAQALNADRTLVEDFSIGEGPHALHVVNAPSPAATASLVVGREVADLAIARFGLGQRNRDNGPCHPERSEGSAPLGRDKSFVASLLRMTG